MQVSKNKRTILVADGELEVREYLETALRCQGYPVELAQDGDEAIACLQSARSEIAAVLLEMPMPNGDGIDTLRQIRHIAPNLPVIVVSGSCSTEKVVTAMKCGATDFLGKPVAPEDLRKVLAKALQISGSECGVAPRCGGTATKAFVGTSERIKEVYELIGEIAGSDAPVLILGETGTGKEIIARELHAQSPRARKPFLKVNCAALPSELVESELFGYERGAFTGAFQRKAGMFEMADGGTILLDEIGDMSIHLQAKLLQVLQDSEFQRIGGRETIKVDVRVLAATHRDLEAAISERSFREDLYYRLNVFNLSLPPLRQREEDIVSLAEFLINKHSPEESSEPLITPELKNAILEYHWPGNVRELENVMRKLVILRRPTIIARELRTAAAKRATVPMPSLVSAMPASHGVSIDTSTILEHVNKAKQQAETEAIVAALNSTHWNRRQAASLLRLEYKALIYKMKKLGVDERTMEFSTPSEICATAGVGFRD